MLGRDLVTVFQPNHTVVACTHTECDITDLEAVSNLIENEAPHIVLNAAAYTDVDGCEANVSEAFSINAFALKWLGELCSQHGTKLVHVSTDYVFNGNKLSAYRTSDCPDPLNVYGMSKLSGEQFVRQYADRHTIVRSSGLYGGSKDAEDHFVGSMLKLGRKRDVLDVVTDQVLSPTWTRKLAESILYLVEEDQSGLFHSVSTGACSWYQFASEIFRHVDVNVDLRETTSDKFDRPAKRPANSVMKNNFSELSFSMPDWDASLQEFLSTDD